MIDEQTFKDVQRLINGRKYADALDALVRDLATNGHVDRSKFNIKYVSSPVDGGSTTPKYKTNPVTGKIDPDGPSEVEIFTGAFESVQELVSVVMHQYQHVLQQQVPGQDPAKFIDESKGGRAGEENAAAEVEAYLWELEHSDLTGLAANEKQMQRKAALLQDKYDQLGGFNRGRQRTYKKRNDKAQQFVKDLTEPPPPMPTYPHVFHHGTNYDNAESLLDVNIEAKSRVDFGKAFYTHTKDNWDLARKWAIRGSYGHQGWGVVTFCIPDAFWPLFITSELIFKDTKSKPPNMPINPDTGKPFKDWKDFVDYNMREDRKGKLPDWGALAGLDVIEGPLWGKLSKTPSIHQEAFTTRGVKVLNDPGLKKLRFRRRWLYLSKR